MLTFPHLRDARAEVRQVFGDVVLPERVEAAPELGVLGEPVLLQVLLARVEQGLHLDLEVPRHWWVRGGGSEVAPNAERRRQPRQKKHAPKHLALPTSSSSGASFWRAWQTERSSRPFSFK